MYKLISSAKDTNDLSIGFDHSRNRRRDELTNNKNVTGKYHLRIMLFGFAEHQEKTSYGLAYKLVLTRKKDDAVIDKAVGIADARNKIDHIYWYVPHYTPSIEQQSILSNQTFKKNTNRAQICWTICFHEKGEKIKIYGILNWVAKKSWKFLYLLL